MHPGKVLWVAVLLAMSSPCEATDASPYRVSIDLRPRILELGNEDAFEREPAEVLFEALGKEAIPALRLALQREDEPVRLGVIEVLAAVDGAEATQILLATTRNDSSVDVRGAALEGLIVRGDEEADDEISRALAAEDPRLYRVALGGCGRPCTNPEELDRIVALAFREPAVKFVAPRAALVRRPRLAITWRMRCLRSSSSARFWQQLATTLNRKQIRLLSLAQSQA